MVLYREQPEEVRIQAEAVETLPPEEITDPCRYRHHGLVRKLRMDTAPISRLVKPGADRVLLIIADQ